MAHYYLMMILTGIVAVLGFLTWHKTRNIAFPLGILILYYWSLQGAWSIITDKMGGTSGKHYYYIEGKLFPLQLDDSYFWALAFYGLFIVVVALTVLVTARSETSNRNAPARAPLVVSHKLILAIAAVVGVLSFVIIYPSFEMARSMNVSAYSFKNVPGELPPLFTLYQIFNRVALLSAAIGLAITLSGKSPKHMKAAANAWTIPGYLAILAFMTVEAFMMGDKAQLVFAGLSGVLFYLANAERPRYIPLGALGVASFFVLAAVDMVRGIPLPMVINTVTTKSPAEWSDMAESFSNSNDQFGAHFSMYGALKFRLAPTYGSSFTSLAASVVPRIFWENRPDDIYVYYADGVYAKPGQGYTIHHATAWYLNFGVAGLIAGAVMLGMIWSGCYNAYWRSSETWPPWMRIFGLIAPWTFTAFLPTLVRAGPETYKGVLLDAFVLPTVVFWIASRDWHRRACPAPLATPESAA